MTGRELRPKAPDEQGLAPEDAVRCLACSTVYSKPLDAAAIGSACPACGYVGWLALAVVGLRDHGRTAPSSRRAL